MTNAKELTMQDLANRCQRRIECATKDALAMRVMLCNEAGECEPDCADQHAWGEAIKHANELVSALLRSHSEGIDMLVSTPTPDITPNFGGK